MSSQANQPLPEGFQLENYRVLRLIASGGFSFVYLAHDEKETPVAIKEYLPATLALRTADNPSPVVPEENLATFRYGLKCFFEEGRALATLSHPNVVRVINFFRANDTVYLVMRYERGRTLQEHIHKKTGPIKEEWIRSTFDHLLNGLREVHSNKLLHLDIKPANIFLAMDGRPVLLDFGAARITLSEEALKLKPMYTAGFAAPEHYRFNPQELGPWADIYSVGATIYTCIAGTPPQAADAREKKDQMIPLKSLARQPYSEDLYAITNECLALDYMQRPQTAFDLQKRLMEEPVEEKKSSFFDTLSKPVSKLFSR